ncbi:MULTISPECIES: ABC transporter substrate-binding protein [unclassified Meiothermus]|uniref:ABC transporter substrate-binding protein n=1 Tax=unclassified Meiothermus TaxID=370471 RepID=UPI000D7C59FE|nr:MULTISPECIES: ABC transporter substrate-binding protein [unclassified Meiothermus]PZA05996.1 ABC transporter substrate-binding protein [Meiothermus sp. Pnk-1]RYM35255.1 extracellular solute-binding protein [Meiothermus sp. PNK-Is4]
MRCLFLLAFLPLAFAQVSKSSLTLYVAGAQLPDVNALLEGFRSVEPGVEVKVFRSGAGEVAAKLRAELEAGNPQPDLIWLVGEGLFRELSQKNLLRRVPPTFPGLPLQYVYEGGKYYEVRLLYNVLAVNTRALPEEQWPRLWTDLSRPRYKGRIAMADPNYSGPALMALGALGRRYGLSYFEGLGANGMQVEQSNPVLQQKLARGEYAIALTNDYGVRQELEKGAPLAIVYPQDGAILAPTPIGIPTWSKNPLMAERFLAFLLSPKGQAIFAERGYYPVMPDAPRPKGAPARLVSLRGEEASPDLLERFNALFNLRR